MGWNTSASQEAQPEQLTPSMRLGNMKIDEFTKLGKNGICLYISSRQIASDIFCLFHISGGSKCICFLDPT